QEGDAVERTLDRGRIGREEQRPAVDRHEACQIGAGVGLSLCRTGERDKHRTGGQDAEKAQAEPNGGIWRAMTPASIEGGKVPKAPPPSPARREAQNASAISAVPSLISNAPWSARTSRSTSRRACPSWGAWPVKSPSSLPQ